jgi:hypothetical protein
MSAFIYLDDLMAHFKQYMQSGAEIQNGRRWNDVAIVKDVTWRSMLISGEDLFVWMI